MLFREHFESILTLKMLQKVIFYVHFTLISWTLFFENVLFWEHLESLLRALMCYLGNIWSLKGLNVPKIAHRGVFGTKSPLLDPPGDMAPICPGDPLGTYGV